jgi:hypothetical protein
MAVYPVFSLGCLDTCLGHGILGQEGQGEEEGVGGFLIPILGVGVRMGIRVRLVVMGVGRVRRIIGTDGHDNFSL